MHSQSINNDVKTQTACAKVLLQLVLLRHIFKFQHFFFQNDFFLIHVLVQIAYNNLLNEKKSVIIYIKLKNKNSRRL